MDKKTFDAEIIRLAKEHQLRTQPPLEPISDEQLARMRSTVHAHISTLFDENSPSASPSADLPNTHSHKGMYARFKDYLKTNFQSVAYPLPTMAFAALSIIAVGVVTLKTASNDSTGLPDIPASLTAQNLDQHVDNALSNSRAMFPDNASEIRSAFTAGVSRADIDVMNKSESLLDKQQRSNLDAKVDTFLQSELTKTWLVTGYALEILHLSALQSLDRMNPTVLESALEFYRLQTSGFETAYAADSINQIFTDNHRYLIETDVSSYGEPDSFQNIIDLTKQMKVVLR